MALHVLRITTAKRQRKENIGRLATDVPCATPAVYLGGCGRSRSAKVESVRINPGERWLRVGPDVFWVGSMKCTHPHEVNCRLPVYIRSTLRM